MALLSDRADLKYIGAWCRLLPMTEEQRAVLQCYTCVFCVDFLSEIGLLANHDTPTTIDEQRIEHLLTILEDLVHTV